VSQRAICRADESKSEQNGEGEGGKKAQKEGGGEGGKGKKKRIKNPTNRRRKGDECCSIRGGRNRRDQTNKTLVRPPDPRPRAEKKQRGRRKRKDPKTMKKVTGRGQR